MRDRASKALTAQSEFEPVQRVLAEAKVKAEAAPKAQPSAVKDASPEERSPQAPELSPDTYDPFQASLEDPPMPEDADLPDTDLPGPPPQVCCLPFDSLLTPLDSF